jgi:hypothetical protein
MSDRERRWRSSLAQIVSGRGLMRGSLLWRERVCGKPNCKCAQGKKHRSLYLVIAPGKGKPQRQFYIPKDWEERVQQWVENHRQIKKLLGELSEVYWEKVRQRQG